MTYAIFSFWFWSIKWGQTCEKLKMSKFCILVFRKILYSWNRDLRLYSYRKLNFKKFCPIPMVVGLRRCSFVPFLCWMLFFKYIILLSASGFWLPASGFRLPVRGREWSQHLENIEIPWLYCRKNRFSLYLYLYLYPDSPDSPEVL